MKTMIPIVLVRAYLQERIRPNSCSVQDYAHEKIAPQHAVRQL